MDSETTKTMLSRTTRAILALLEAGAGLPAALRSAHGQSGNGALATTADIVERGGSLFSALELHPDVFDAAYVWFVRSGEVGEAFQAGHLATALRCAASYLEDDALFESLIAASRSNGAAAAQLDALEAARFLHAIGLLLSVGVPILDAMLAWTEAPGHEATRSEAHRLRQALLEGRGVGESLAEQSSLYSRAWSEAATLGEDVGVLDAVLLDITNGSLEMVARSTGVVVPRNSDARRFARDGDDATVDAIEALCAARALELGTTRRDALLLLHADARKKVANHIEYHGRWTR